MEKTAAWSDGLVPSLIDLGERIFPTEQGGQ